MASVDIASEKTRPDAKLPMPPLEPGDHLDQPTFHERYLAMPENVRAELIGGVVYMAAAAKRPHGRYQGLLMGWFHDYCTETSGTDMVDAATVVLGDDCEPEPDGALVILGGQTHEDDDGFLVGAPELLAEVASSSESYDLHSKCRDYEHWGVQEYVVFVVRKRQVVWFVRENDTFVEMSPEDDGSFRSRQFPGLWLDPQAFFKVDRKRLREALHRGLATPEHAAFVERLKSIKQ